MKVYFTDPEKSDLKALDLLKQNGFKILTTKQQYHADVLFVRASRKVNENYLNHFSNLKYVLTGSVGIDHIDKSTCLKRNIVIINAPGSNANSVAEHVMGLTFMLLRNIDIHRRNFNNGQWRNPEALAEEIQGKIIGLVGCGAIGRLVSNKFLALGAEKVLGYDPFLQKSELKKYLIEKTTFLNVIKRADIISLHLPLTPETKNLISFNELQLMKSSTYVINTSRGGIINEKHLVKALNQGFIAGAALDVFEDEPRINKTLLHQDNLICTPHIAGFTKQAREAMTIEPIRNFLEIIKQKSSSQLTIYQT
jgi:D-3-phosphoglycerate dehydrogenase